MVEMIEIEQRANRIRTWQQLFNEYGIEEHDDWCICVGLCETAGWVNKYGNNIFEWVKPGCKNI